MSTLFDAVKSLELSQDRWRPYGEKLFAFHERGALSSDLIKLEVMGSAKNSIAKITASFLALLEGDRNDFTEGWERFQSACHLCKIDLSEKYKEDVMITEGEVEELTQSVFEIKKVASKAANLWQKTSSRRNSFCNEDLATREIFIVEAQSGKSTLGIAGSVCEFLGFKKVEKSNSDFKSWGSSLPKSPEIQDFHEWLS